MSGFLDPKHQRNRDPLKQGDHVVNSASGKSLSPGNESADPSWQEIFEQALPVLRGFLHNRLTQESDIEDCLQTVSVKMLERGSGVAPAARRAWLFRVAANESARMWRSRAASEKALQRYASDETDIDFPENALTSDETNQQIMKVLTSLPPAWQRVVRMRIHENMTFQQIADQLDIPLGTALTQMRRALERMRQELDTDAT
ncbi:MAG: sigma-70 family RNA polymerase sigma factor [Rubripirellula sp.]|nr:sigma-70 family RNA polymerase sigma factor [Rubripirellula sp.]